MHAPEAPREVWLIRHGESIANAGGRTRNALTCALTERGFRQAEQLGAALERRPGLIVHSPYIRARHTAEAAMRRYPQVPVEEWPVQEVQYLDPALCVDTTQEERHVLAEQYWAIGDPAYAAPNAESFIMFIERARAALARLAHRAEQLSFVFCHGHFMGALVWSLLFNFQKLDAAAMQHFKLFREVYLVRNCAIQTCYLHRSGAHSLGSLWMPEGIEHEPLKATLRQDGM